MPSPLVRPMNSAALGLVLSLAGWAAFSLGDMFSKMLMGQVSPFEVAFAGGLVGCLLIPNVKREDETWRDLLPKSAWGIWLLRAVSAFVATSLSVEAFMLLPMPEAMAIMFLLPLVTNILQFTILRESVSPVSWATTIIGFIGILVVLRPGIKHIGWGEICALGVSIALGLWVISYRLGKGKCSDLSLYTAVLAGLLIGDGIAMLWDFQLPAHVTTWCYLLGYGFLAGLGQLLLMLATKLIPPARVSLTQYSQMLWSVAFSWAVFHEHLDRWSILGVAIVTLSGGTGWFYRHLQLLKRGKLRF